MVLKSVMELLKSENTEMVKAKVNITMAMRRYDPRLRLFYFC